MHKLRVKGAMEVGMSSCENSDVEEERPDILDDALKDVTGWVDLENANHLIMPKLSIRHIHQYFIKKKVRKDQVTASKPFERGYRIYDAKKVQLISIYPTSDDNLFIIIRAAVLPSQKTDWVYQTFIVYITHPFMHITPIQMERTKKNQGTKGHSRIYPAHQETILSETKQHRTIITTHIY